MTVSPGAMQRRYSTGYVRHKLGIKGLFLFEYTETSQEKLLFIMWHVVPDLPHTCSVPRTCGDATESACYSACYQLNRRDIFVVEI